MNPKNELKLTDNYGQTYKITTPTAQIGSSPQCTIILDEPSIAELHAEINFDGKKWLLHNKSEENQVYVNNEIIQQPYQLNDGDIVSIGEAILCVSLQESKPRSTLYKQPDDSSKSDTLDDLSCFRSTGEACITTSSTLIETQPTSQKRCRGCGQWIHLEAKICPYCGVEQEKPQTTIVSKKNRTTAALLGIFLGSIGAHKFYLGQSGQGLLYLLFFWTYIPGVIGFFEGIHYFTMSDKQFADKFA